MKWLALGLLLGLGWTVLRILRSDDQVDDPERVSAAWMREQTYDKSGY